MKAIVISLRVLPAPADRGSAGFIAPQTSAALFNWAFRLLVCRSESGTIHIIQLGNREMSDQQFQLRVHKGPEPGKTYQLTSVSITIGRDPMADITINDPEVSRQHARLIGTMSGYRIQDLGSTNGTFVEGVRLGGEPVELQQEQVIAIGSSVALIFQVRVDEGDQLATVVDRALLPPESPQQEQEEIEDMTASEFAPEELQQPLLLEPDDEEMELVDDGLADEAVSDLPAFAENPPKLTEWEKPIHEEPAAVYEFDAKPENSQSNMAAEPVVIPHQGDPPHPPTPSPRRNNRRPTTIIAALLLLVLCCCCSFVLFVYYYGGDWLLRQMGLLP
jgi:pSer/pThr/pTyr-binding forkhead associated (FHA) protein